MGNGVFLDSGNPTSERGRYDILTAAPEQVWHLATNSTSSESFFAELEQAQQTHALDEHPKHPFTGGIMGQFSYDLGKTLETLPCTSIKDINYPIAWAGLYLWAVIVDHHDQQSTLVIHPALAEAKKHAIEQLLTRGDATNDSEANHRFSLTRSFNKDTSEVDYKKAIARIHDYIYAGDCYQVNFTQRFSSEYRGDPWAAYCALRKASPTPFSAFMENDFGHVLSLSPERLLSVTSKKVTTQPIKGTEPRFSDPAADQAAAQSLLASEKNRAENLMIVDLLRNDLSKVCALNSVKVPKLFELQSYQNVHHLVSTIEGQLPDSTSNIELLKACFPGGSITGAPKIRAMEIIDELESHLRSIYCGSVGYLSFDGKMDMNITIRTLLCEQNKVYCWAGGGIVSDSTADSEYQESLNKVANLLHCLETL